MLLFSVLLIAAVVTGLPVNSTLEGRAPLATIYSKCTKPNIVALTWDDGPYTWTTDIVNTLNRNGAKGTFFVNGNNWQCIYSQANVNRLKTAYGSGHQIASHTWAHKNLNSLNRAQGEPTKAFNLAFKLNVVAAHSLPIRCDAAVTSEFSKLDDALAKIVGVRPAFVRPPYGSYNNLVREVAAERGQVIAMWDFDSGDATGSGATKIKSAYTSLSNRKPSSILALNHEVYETSAHTVLDHALQVLKAKGYRFVTMADCVGRGAYISTGAPKPRDGSWTC